MSFNRFLGFLSVFALLGSCGGVGGGGSASSGGGGSGSTPPTQPTNNAPSFTSANTTSVLEGTTAALTIEVSDEDSDDTISQSIVGGADADLFELGVCNASRCTSNTLSFKAAPNFENPQDADGDNDYVVIVEATDASDPVEQTVTISVTNAVEGRIVDAPLSGAAICIDQDEDWKCDVGPPDDADCPAVFPPVNGCFTEPSGTSDERGYYSLAEGQEFPDQEMRVLSIGGTDILTNKELSGLALIAEIPTDASQAIAVTPLSTVVTIATDPAATLVALGFPDTVTPEQITSIDPWALATDSTEPSGEFASSASLAQSIGITTTELESVADNALTTSVQIANLVQIADALVADTTTSGVQDAAERAAMISSTVTQELVETIDAAVASAGSAAATSVDLGDGTVTNEVLKGTVEESAALIVAEIQAKQTAGMLDLSDTNDTTVMAILEIKETQEVISQMGLDNDFVAQIAAIATEAAKTNQLVKEQVTSGGIKLLTTASTASALAEIISDTNILANQLLNDVITIEKFSSSANGDVLAAATGVLKVNNPPLFSAESISVSLAENRVDSVVLRLSASDADGDSIVYLLTGGVDQDLFSLSESGELSFKTKPDHESPSDADGDNVYSLEVSASDGTSVSSQFLIVTILARTNVAPVILNASICSTAYENVMSVCELEGTDGDGDSLIFAVTGTDAADFVISNSVLKFAVNPDFENPADANTNNEYEITLNASDGLVTTTRDLKLQVLNVEENQLGEGSFGTSVTE